MKKNSKQGKFTFVVRYQGRNSASIRITSEPGSEKIEIKYANIDEPKEVLNFEQFNSIISSRLFHRGERIGFYIINGETLQKEIGWINIDWGEAPPSDDVTRDVPKVGDLTEIIKKIGG